MKVLIADVVTSGAECRIHFESECGKGSALWSGTPPVAGAYRFIELAVESPIAMGEDLVVTDEQKGVRMGNGGTALVGDVTAVEDDGYVQIEFGCGGIALEVTGAPPLLRGRYRLNVPFLKAFDCDY